METTSNPSRAWLGWLRPEEWVVVALSLFGALQGCALFGGDQAFEVPVSTTQSFTLPVDMTPVLGDQGAGVAAPIFCPVRRPITRATSHRTSPQIRTCGMNPVATPNIRTQAPRINA